MILERTLGRIRKYLLVGTSLSLFPARSGGPIQRSHLRTAAKLIRFRPDELARITARARACGRTPARFIRETALGAVPPARRASAAPEVLRALARLGASLDALAHYGRTHQDPGLLERVTPVLHDHDALIRTVLTGRRPVLSR